MPVHKCSKRRNLEAKELWTPKYRPRIIPDKKKQENKNKARDKGSIIDHD